MQVGHLIKSRRLQMKLTLTEVAKRSGLSVPFLSQVERGEAGLSVQSLVKIAEALGVTLNYFLNVPEPDTPIRYAKDFHFFSLVESKTRMARIGSVDPSRQLEPVLSIVPPNYETELIQHAGEEFVYVLKGEIIVKLGRKQYRLSAGDTAHFKSGIRHRWRNPTNQEAHVLWIGTPKLF
ncbi:MAG: XRE family transcriptional regulator [Meiothermus sp.]|nr:XRE family transcriptional regulator [Meiothermus sp.]